MARVPTQCWREHLDCRLSPLPSRSHALSSVRYGVGRNQRQRGGSSSQPRPCALLQDTSRLPTRGHEAQPRAPALVCDQTVSSRAILARLLFLCAVLMLSQVPLGRYLAGVLSAAFVSRPRAVWVGLIQSAEGLQLKTGFPENKELRSRPWYRVLPELPGLPSLVWFLWGAQDWFIQQADLELLHRLCAGSGDIQGTGHTPVPQGHRNTVKAPAGQEVPVPWRKGRKAAGRWLRGRCHRSPGGACLCPRPEDREGAGVPGSHGPHPPGKLHSTAIDQKEPCRWSQMGANGDKSQTDGDGM